MNRESDDMQDVEFEAPGSGDDQQEIAALSEEEDSSSTSKGKRKRTVIEEEGESDGGDDKSNETDLLFSRYVVQHGAHREFRIPNKFVIHEAKKPMAVSCGQHIGKMLASKSGKVWEGMRHYHVTIMGGELKTTGEHQEGPYVCFKPPEGSAESDDLNWLRPIPSKVMEFFQPIWTKEIQNKYSDDDEKCASLLASYKPVLKWHDGKIDGKPKLSVENLGVGKGDLLVLKKRLKSIKATEQTKGDNASETSTSGKTEKKDSKVKNSDSDANLITGTFVEGACTVKLGNADSVHTFTSEGVLYATYLP